MKRTFFDIPEDAFAAMLKVKPGIEIVNVEHDAMRRAYRIVVDGSGLPEKYELSRIGGVMGCSDFSELTQ